MSKGEPQRIRQIGLVVELEDGTLVRLHSDLLACGMVTINTEAETVRDWNGRILRMTPLTDILIEGLAGYRMEIFNPASRGITVGDTLGVELDTPPV